MNTNLWVHQRSLVAACHSHTVWNTEALVSSHGQMQSRKAWHFKCKIITAIANPIILYAKMKKEKKNIAFSILPQIQSLSDSNRALTKTSLWECRPPPSTTIHFLMIFFVLWQRLNLQETYFLLVQCFRVYMWHHRKSLHPLSGTVSSKSLKRTKKKPVSSPTAFHLSGKLLCLTLGFPTKGSHLLQFGHLNWVGVFWWESDVSTYGLVNS